MAVTAAYNRHQNVLSTTSHPYAGVFAFGLSRVYERVSCLTAEIAASAFDDDFVENVVVQLDGNIQLQGNTAYSAGCAHMLGHNTAGSTVVDADVDADVVVVENGFASSTNWLAFWQLI